MAAGGCPCGVIVKSVERERVERSGSGADARRGRTVAPGSVTVCDARLALPAGRDPEQHADETSPP